MSPAGRRVARALVGPMPIPVADAIRRVLAPGAGTSVSARIRRALLRLLVRGGIPRAVSTFRLVDNPDLEFVAVDSQVLEQLYWSGEQGWEPELLPWWRLFCQHSRSVLELGTNVGYFAVQGGRAAPGVRYIAVEPHPVSADACRTHLALNGVTSVELVQAAAVVDPSVSSVPLLVPADQAATPTVAFLSSDSELPADMARDVAVLDVPAIDVRRLINGVDLIKMDVEGQEHVLLTAIRAHLRERRPTLFVEVLAGTVQLRAVLADLCATDGYRCYALTRQGVVELDGRQLATVRLMDEYGCQDVILSAAHMPSASGQPISVGEGARRITAEMDGRRPPLPRRPMFHVDDGDVVRMTITTDSGKATGGTCTAVTQSSAPATASRGPAARGGQTR